MFFSGEVATDRFADRFAGAGWIVVVVHQLSELAKLLSWTFNSPEFGKHHCGLISTNVSVEGLRLIVNQRLCCGVLAAKMDVLC